MRWCQMLDASYDDDVKVLFTRALLHVKQNTDVSGIDALMHVCGVPPTDREMAVRRRAAFLFGQASISIEPGVGSRLHERVFEIALERMSSKDVELAQAPRVRRTLAQGEIVNVVAPMALEPVSGASCGFRLSRKVGKQGIASVAAGSAMVYLGQRELFAGRAPTRRLIFVVRSGTQIVRDGVTSSLESDVEVAGVMNHIDESSAYNTRRTM